MKRPQKLRKAKDTILIITNGRQTEKNYFENLTNSFTSMFSIKVEYKNMECDEMVEYASRIKKEEYNQIWCVFDIDESHSEGHLVPAIIFASKNNIKIAYSN